MLSKTPIGRSLKLCLCRPATTKRQTHNIIHVYTITLKNETRVKGKLVTTTTKKNIVQFWWILRKIFHKIFTNFHKVYTPSTNRLPDWPASIAIMFSSLMTLICVTRRISLSENLKRPSSDKLSMYRPSLSPSNRRSDSNNNNHNHMWAWPGGYLFTWSCYGST